MSETWALKEGERSNPPVPSPVIWGTCVVDAAHMPYTCARVGAMHGKGGNR